MLVQFSVANFRSIAEQQTFSLVASADQHLRQGHVEENAGGKGLPALLHSAVLYGPNAAGKSSLVRALDFVDDFVMGSLARKSGQKIPVQAHAFDKALRNAPSEFELTFILDGVRYQFGFSVTEDRVDSEWLYAYPEGRPQRWIDRKGDDRSNWYINPALKGSKKTWIESTREDALILSTAVQLNSTALKPVHDWFKDKLRVASRGAMFTGYTVEQINKHNKKSDVLEFLAAADLGISSIDLKSGKFEADALPKDMPTELREFFSKRMENEEFTEVFIDHDTESGNTARFTLEEESDGTQKMFGMAGALLDVLRNGRVLVVDEFDTSLHPVLVRHLLNLFHDRRTNVSGAQLIFTTHDTSLLNAQEMRRDQIWFAEKDKEYQTHLYPLTDFSPRRTESLERGYLQGRYGALPFLGSLELSA